MAHSDDDGLVLPPRLAPAHVVIMPILFKAESREQVLEYCRNLRDELRSRTYDGRRIEVELDERDVRGGDKVWNWIKKGVPIRLEIGPRDIASDSVFMGRRDRSAREKESVPRARFLAEIPDLLQEIQDHLLERARALRARYTRIVNTREEFFEFFGAKGSEAGISGGFALAHWNGDEAIAVQMQKELSVTIRCIPVDDVGGAGTCIFTGEPSPRRVVWARAY